VLGIATTASTEDPLATCEGGLAEVAHVWNLERNTEVHAALDRVDTEYARVIGVRVLADLDAYRARWSKVHKAACRDYRTPGSRPTVLIDGCSA